VGPAPSKRNQWPPGPSPIPRRDFLVGAGLSAALLFFRVPFVLAEQKQRSEKVGFILPEKGAYAGEAGSLLAGFELYLKENQADSPRLEILRKDPGPDGEKTLEAVTTLAINQGTRFLVSPPSLAAAEQAIHALAGGKVIHFVTCPSVRLVAGEMCLPESFRVRGNTYQAVHSLAPWALKNVGLKVLLTGSDEWLGNEQADFFASSFERAGGSFADRVMVSADSGDFDEVMQAVRTSKPDFVFASFRDKQALAFVKAFRNASPRLSQSVIGPESLIPYPQAFTGEGKLLTGIKTLTELKNPRDLVRRIKRKLNRTVSHALRAAEGYDIAAIICKTLHQTAAGEDELASMIKIMEEMEIEGPRGKVRFDKNHELILNTLVQEWEYKSGSWEWKMVEDMGTCASLDFGCGKVGFPKRAEPEPKEEEEPLGDSEE
jgi:ABC-type branched-subunit amino acid transport system substrate-binding protein